eukprot:scaffold63495_cov39-Phaeocystis_antarctica.AAC.3
MRVASAAVRCILITGPSSPHPGVDTGAYATPLVANTGRGARHTDGRDRGGYMCMHMCMLHVHAERPSSSVVTVS